LDHVFHPAIVSLAAEMGLKPIPTRGANQCGLKVGISGQTITLWVGFYPGFSGQKGVDWQVALSTDAKAIRWGTTEAGVKLFLQTTLIPGDAVPIARKGKDLKALRKG
jgi:hypothetical protein